MWSEIQSKAFIKICNALNSNNIDWMIMRNYEGLPNNNRSKDLDLGVTHKNFNKAYKIISNELKELGFSKVFKIKYQYAICSTFFFCRDDVIESIKIDLIDGFVWRGAQIVSFDKIFLNACKYNDFYVPSKVDDAFMLLVKPLMTGGIIKEKYVNDINNALDTDMYLFLDIYKNIFGNVVFNKTFQIIKNQEYDKLIEYKREMCIAAWKNCFFNAPLKTVFNFFEHTFLEISRCIFRKRPTLFSVLGPDGVGKTTFLDKFSTRLSELCVSELRDIHIFHFRPNIFPNIKKLLSDKNYDESEEEFNNPHRGKKTNKISSLLRISYYWLDYVLGYYLKIKLMCRHNSKVIFDRYSSDYLVDPERSRVYLPYWLRNIFVKTTPQVDISYVLMCDAETIYSRKQELSIYEINEILDGYTKVIKKNKKYVILDANNDPEKMAFEACKIFIDYLQDI